MTDLVEHSAVAQRSMLEGGEVSARELLAAHLQRIDEVNPLVNAIVGQNREVAAKQAAKIDERRAAGQRVGPLAGLVTAHKDLQVTKDFPTSFGSPLFADHQPHADSLLVKRVNEADAVAVGKTNVPEFGAGSHSFNPVHGTTLNPYDTTKSAGGSSGGAAVALATNMVAIADGSDMGGSLRNPAAWNNVVGFRNSPRVVPTAEGGWSILAVEGAMGRTVEDLALLLGVIGQPYAADPLSRCLELPDVIPTRQRPLRVAYSATLGGLPVEEDVAQVVKAMCVVAEGLGWQIEEAEPSFAMADETFMTLRAYEFANGPLLSAGEQIVRTKATVQGEVGRGLALKGTEVAKAQHQLASLWRSATRFFDDYDLLLAPVTQLSPFPANEEFPTVVGGETIEHYIDWMRSCCRVTTMGMPALSLPAGFTDAGLPVGVQLIGGPFSDLNVLRAAKTLEMATNYHQRRPSL